MSFGGLDDFLLDSFSLSLKNSHSRLELVEYAECLGAFLHIGDSQEEARVLGLEDEEVPSVVGT